MSTQAVIDYDEEGAVKRIQAPINPTIIAAIIPNERPLPARVLRSSDATLAVQSVLLKSMVEK
jgi:hypothetical protein